MGTRHDMTYSFGLPQLLDSDMTYFFGLPEPRLPHEKELSQQSSPAKRMPNGDLLASLQSHYKRLAMFILNFVRYIA